TLCGRDAVQIHSGDTNAVDLSLMAKRWEPVGRVQANPFFVRLFPDDSHSLTLFRDGRVVVTGTSEISVARTLCDRFVGG
ncbi:MAG: ThiF family adenylyltransferase, partial [Rubripirellula sp.]